MSGGNFENRVEDAFELVTGPLPGDGIFRAFKSEMIKEKIFQKMFGIRGDRIFIDQIPNWNETILPGMILNWKSETFKTMDNYFEGQVMAIVALPVMLRGDINSLRRVGNIIQRWMGGQMNLFDQVPGLTMFGYGADYNYEGLARFDGFSAPAIQITIPFKLDLQRYQVEVPEFDPTAPIDQSDVGFIEKIILSSIDDPELDKTLIANLEIINTGQTNV